MKIKRSLAVLGASATLALGFGGVMAPSAQAHTPAWGDASYTQSDLRNDVVHRGTAYGWTGGDTVAPSYSTASPRCWNTRTSWRTYTASCSGTYWRLYADCTDSNSYVTPPQYGTKRVAVHCPAGTRALRGGAIGR